MLGVVALACSGAPAPKPHPPPVAAVRIPRPTTVSWRYHPSAAAPMLAAVELEGRGVLWVGRRGERWLHAANGERLEAALPAPEDLVAVASDPTSGHWFVGRSGTSYRALEPLGPFVDATVPLEPLAQVSAAGRTLLGVSRDQRLLRSPDDGQSWTRVGPPDTAFVDVAMDAKGNALALASPEALWQSEDSGLTFRRSDLPTTGALALVAEANGDGIRITSLLGMARFGAGGVGGKLALPLLDEVLRRGVDLPLGEDARALSEHAAALSGGRYLEARVVEEGKREWRLVSGPFGGPLQARPFDEAKGCSAVRVSTFERFAYFACFRATPSATQRVELFASSDGGGKFAHVAPDFWGRLSRVRLAVGRGGALLLSGACPPNVEGPGCSPAGILYRRAVVPQPGAKPGASAQAGYELALARVPSLSDSGNVELAFDAEGKTAFALSGSTKGSALTLFVSRDAGQSFDAHDLGEATRDQDMEAGVPLIPGRDGTVALVPGGRRSASLVVVDAEGRVLHAGSPPDRALLGAAGLSALAIGAETGEVQESLDGGVTWEPRGKLPRPLCPGDAACEVPIACSSEGCVVGDELTRVGWGAGDAPAFEAYSPVESSGETGLERRLRTPLACVLAPGPWRSLPGVRELPDAAQTAIGDAAWFALADDPTNGAVRVLHGRGGAHPRVDMVELFPPLAKPSEFAQSVTSQIEGAAAIRYRVPDARGGVPRLRDVEVAWDNRFEGRVGRARVADAGIYTPGDYERAAGDGPQVARPDLLSIAERGLYLRAHVKTRADQPTLFLDGATALPIPPFTWPPAMPRGGHAEMAHLGTNHVGLFLLSRGGALARARLTSGNWAFDAASVGLPDPEAFGTVQVVNITYLKGQAALHVEELDERGRRSRARVFPLNAEGPVTGTSFAAPTTLDLGATPTPCSPPERAASARLVAHGYPGARHPVVVTDSVEPPRALITGDAVLHGTKEAPCTAAFDIHPVPGGLPDPATAEGGAILLDDLAHAWLFKKTKESRAEGGRVEYRGMSCRFDPNLELPEEILNAPEALAPKR
jgi:hypothetical protein